jgi:Asp-tRNA(Asn)/Glu-tRNA(Gln) amidotransferase B subunit
MEENIIFKKFANSFINEILPLIKKNHVELTKEF